MSEKDPKNTSPNKYDHRWDNMEQKNTPNIDELQKRLIEIRKKKEALTKELGVAPSKAEATTAEKAEIIPVEKTEITPVEKAEIAPTEKAEVIPMEKTEVIPAEKSELSLPLLEDKDAASPALEDKTNKPFAIDDKYRDLPPILQQEIMTRRAQGLPDINIIDVEKSEIRELNQNQEDELARQREIEDMRAREAEKNQQKLLEHKQSVENQNITENEDVKKKMEEIDKLKLVQELIDKHKEVEAAKVDLDRAMKEATTPIIAINADFAYDEKELAHDLAEQELNTEVAKSKFIKKLWKGTLFKKYYEKKYEKEFLSEERTNKDGKTVRDLIREQKQSVIERFTLGAIEGEDENTDGGYIHTKAGEKLVKADKETNDEIRHAIEQYAGYHIRAGEKVSDLDRKFKNHIDRVIQEAIDDGRLGESAKDTDYLTVAKQAAALYEEAIARRGKAEHEMAMKEVMAGFQVYNAEVRSGVRTDAHRDNIDKIVNKLESTKIGQFIPAEIIAGAAGVALGLTQTGIRAAVGAGGGIIASSVISGLKERNRMTEDRARMMRDVAKGMEYQGNSKESDKKLRGTEKHEARIGGTLYDMQKASDLTDRIKEAMNYEGEGRGRMLMSAIAEARVRIDFSDSEQKDLISYSSAENIGKERLELDKVLIMAEKALTEKGKKDYEIMQAEIREKIIEDAEKHDKEFKNIRTIAAVKKAGKTLALGSAVFFGSQEIMAAIDPNKIGVFEKIFNTNKNESGDETILASGFGALRGKYEKIIDGPNSTHADNITDPATISRYEANGYTKIKVKDAWTELKQTLAEVNPADSTARVDVKYDGWANNGTKISDGNEIRASIINGKFVSSMKGSSTFNGQTVNYDPTKVKAYLTVGDSKFEIAGSLNESGQLTWGDNGVFTTTTGETIKAIGDNGEKLYKYFEIAADNGVDSDGIQHIIPLATDTGANTFSGTIRQVVETSIPHPAVYSFVKEIPAQSETFVRGVTTSGLGFAPDIIARTGLGEARARQLVPEENIEVMPENPVEFNPEASEATPENPEANIQENPEPINNPESTANNSEPVTTPEPAATPEAAPEPTTTPEAAPAQNEFETWEKGILDEIKAKSDILGGEDGIANITSTDIYYNNSSEISNRLSEWWNSLSEEGKNTVEDIVKKIQDSKESYNLKWGNSLQTWLALNGII